MLNGKNEVTPPVDRGVAQYIYGRGTPSGNLQNILSVI